jgi:hypothetical protein
VILPSVYAIVKQKAGFNGKNDIKTAILGGFWAG